MNIRLWFNKHLPNLSKYFGPATGGPTLSLNSEPIATIKSGEFTIPRSISRFQTATPKRQSPRYLTLEERRARLLAGGVSTTKGDTVTPEQHEAAPGAPEPINPDTGQHKSYYVLSPSERAKGFVRPVRRSYVHTQCQGVTSMSQDIAETYAREPTFYGRTFCTTCRGHFPVGPNGEFVWLDYPEEKVGT